MHSYDYRCKACKQEFTLSYKSYTDYDSATPQCPHCENSDLARLITRVAIQQPSRDFTGMSANEMVSVMEAGDSRQVGEMFNQIGGGAPELGADYHETTDRLLKGESMEKVNRDMQAKDSASGDSSASN
jgi:putative FmdB family regulatory protein